MAESHKGTSPAAGSQKKSSSLDEDFGNDFLTSWKSAKVGKDSIDFDVETVPCIGKKSFNFDKLDDFELGGAFDKISSFKVDMSDLDFSSPHKKVDRHKEKSAKESGKQESKQDKFSFTFDFHELDRFSLDSDLLKGKKVTSKSMENVGADCSVEHDRNQDFGGNSVTSTDAFERDKAKREPNADGLAASRPRNLTDPSTVNGSVLLSSNLANHDMSYEARTSAERQINTVDEKQVNTHNNEWPRGHSNGACSKKPYAEKAVQENILQSVSGHGSADEASSKLQAGLTSGPLNADSAKKQDTSLRSLESSQSRNSSPVNSYNSRCGPETTKLESLNISDGFQKCQGKQVEAIGGRALSATTKHQIDGGNASDTAISQKNLDELKNYGEKQTPSSVILQPSPYRDSGIVKSVAVKEKTPTARQFKSLEGSAGSSSQSTSSLIPKQMIPIHHRKIETIHFYPANEKIEPKKNDWQPENQNGSILKSVDRSMIKGRSIILGKEKNDKDIDASCQSIASSATKSSSLAFISRTAPTKSSSIISVERQDVSLKDDKKSDIPVLTSSRLKKLNISTTKSTIPRETKSVKFLKEKLVLPKSMISKVANPVTTEKHAFLSPSLKRKTLEEPKEDPVHQNPLKHGTDSATKRRTSLEASPKFYEKVITSPIGALVVGSMMNFEIPVLVENDGNAEKAEACAKELDDICNMLKKKHEEAKELLVRVIVNDNSLLMLNHPMFEEKIHALQRFADSLQSKEFW